MYTEATPQDFSGLRGSPWLCPLSWALHVSVLQRGGGCPLDPSRAARPHSCTANPSSTGPGARGTQRATVGPTMQRQRCPGEISAVELVRRDHPEDSALTASDSCRVQPHRRRSQLRRHHRTSPRSTPFIRRGRSGQLRGLCQPFSTPARGGYRGQTPTRVQIRHWHVSDVTLGKSSSWNRWLHL